MAARTKKKAETFTVELADGVASAQIVADGILVELDEDNPSFTTESERTHRNLLRAHSFLRGHGDTGSWEPPGDVAAPNFLHDDQDEPVDEAPDGDGEPEANG